MGGFFKDNKEKMQTSDVLKIVEHEIGDNWAISNAHGVDLKNCLLSTPVKTSFLDPSQGGSPKELWIVLEELPEQKTGYKIVFDEKVRKFGLAITDTQTKQNVFLGIYGSFLNTLMAM